MKDNETEYLDALFASSSDMSDEAEVELPLVEVPANLSGKLYAIAESAPAGSATVKRGFFESWPKITSIAASVLIAFMGLQFYQQQQTFKQLEQAQSDLATALHYLGEANRITQEHVLNSLNDNINKTGVVPAMQIGRDALMPNHKQRERETKPETQTYKRTL